MTITEKTILLSIKQIIDSQESLTNLLSIKLPIKISYRLSRLNTKLKSELADYETARINLIKNLGELTNSQTDSWQVRQENIPEFAKEFNRLQNEIIEIPFEKLKLEDIGEITIEPKNLPEWLFEY